MEYKNNFHFIVKTLGIEAQEIADQMGVTRQTVTDWIMERKVLNKERGEKLGDIFGVDAKYFEQLHLEMPLSEKIKMFEKHILNVLGVQVSIAMKEESRQT